MFANKYLNELFGKHLRVNQQFHELSLFDVALESLSKEKHAVKPKQL